MTSSKFSAPFAQLVHQSCTGSAILHGRGEVQLKTIRDMGSSGRWFCLQDHDTGREWGGVDANRGAVHSRADRSERHGAYVYIDKKDESLPPTTSRATAAILRGRIKQCRKFILLMTKNSKESRWMPWELGLADGYKTTGHLATFPTVDTSTDHKRVEREYLGLYDRVVFGQFKGQSSSVFMVSNQETNEGTELSQWLRR